MSCTSPAADEERPTTRKVRVTSPRGSYDALLTLPLSPAWKSAVVVIGSLPDIDPNLASFSAKLAVEGHATLTMGYDVEAARSFVATTESVDAAFAFLHGEASAEAPRFGVVGFGEGGFAALVAGYRCRVGAAVCFYGEGPARLRLRLSELIDQPRRHAASLLFLFGGEDASVRPADIAAIHDRLGAFRMHHTCIIYPRTKGEFCRADGDDYRATAADDAWQRVLHALETAPRLRHRFRRPRPSA